MTAQRLAAIGVMAACTAAAVGAQSEKISLNIVPPRPGSTTHYQIVQETVFDVAPDGKDESALPAAKMAMKSVMHVTQQAGAVDDEGRTEVKLTYDDVKAEVCINGRPGPAPATNPLLGKTLVATYAADG